MKSFQANLLLFLSVIAALCGCGIVDSLPGLDYKPTITFSGYFDGDYLKLTGNASHPNTVERIGDTIRMYFYSPLYDGKSRTWSGDQLRIDLYRTNDSTNLHGTNNALVKLSRYNNSNETYLVSAADSAYSPPLGAKMAINTLQIRNSGHIEIAGFYAALHMPRGYTVGMEIEDGVISGKFGE